MSAGGTLITFDVIYYYVTLELHQNDFCVRKSQTHFPRSGDVIHPQLLESGSGYETSTALDMKKFPSASIAA